jgi:hypothetical protein
LGGSGTKRRARSRRFEWYKLQRGSGSIGRVVSGEKVAVAVTSQVTAAQRVAVVGWQWDESIQEVGAVRMVQVREW